MTMLLMKFLQITVITCVLMTILVDEVEGRRKILRGRKTITREYYKPSLLPAWANVTLYGVAIVIVGVVFYFAMSKFVLGSSGGGIFTLDNEV